MSTTTIEDQLAEVRRRIARLQVLAKTGLVAERARIQRHLDALHQEEASVLAAERRAPDEVEEKLGQLRTRLAVAENSLAADVSDEWTTFAAAVEDELRSWDTYLERLQATAVAKAGNARERAEAAIADVRTRRIAVYDRLAQAREDVDGAWHEQRNHVSAARDELEQKADRTVGEVGLNGADMNLESQRGDVAQRTWLAHPAGEAPCSRPARKPASAERGDRVADWITAFAGSMWFVYIHILWFGCWIGFGVEQYPYGLLTMIVSLEAIFLASRSLSPNPRFDQGDSRGSRPKPSGRSCRHRSSSTSTTPAIYLTTSTSHGASTNSSPLTEPNRRRRTTPRCREPTTIRSAPVSRAASTIASTGSRAGSSVSQTIPRAASFRVASARRRRCASSSAGSA